MFQNVCLRCFPPTWKYILLDETGLQQKESERHGTLEGDQIYGIISSWFFQNSIFSNHEEHFRNSQLNSPQKMVRSTLPSQKNRKLQISGDKDKCFDIVFDKNFRILKFWNLNFLFFRETWKSENWEMKNQQHHEIRNQREEREFTWGWIQMEIRGAKHSLWNFLNLTTKKFLFALVL